MRHRALAALAAMEVVSNLRPYEPWQEELLPRVLPADWAMHELPGRPLFFDSRDGLRVLSSAMVEADGKRWQHVSVSRSGGLPSWKDLRRVKDLFIGRDKLAVQVLPREDEYVNDMPSCLHLWHCLDGDPIPDFRHEGRI